MTLKEILKYAILPIDKPIVGLQSLLNNEKKLSYSVIIFLFLGVIYTLSVQVAYTRGVGAAVEPFIKIDAEDYYYWQRFFQIPFFFITSIVFAGIVRLLAAGLGGQGKFEDIFCIICISQTLPMFLTMWIPETIGFLFFPGQTIMPIWADVGRQIIGIIWPLVITVLGIALAEKIRWQFSAIFTLIASIPMTILMVIFIR